MIHVLFFAQLREQLGYNEYHIDAHQTVTTIDSLLEDVAVMLGGDAAVWLSAPELLVAINQEIAKRSDLVKDGDEVAVFPPVTGG